MPSKLSGPMLPPASGAAKSLVVLLHGYGSDGNDLIALGQYWRGALPDTLFVAPNAHETCTMNPAGYQWFALDLDRAISRITGSETARPMINDFLDNLWAQTGLGPEDTVLVGFSQGAMMALDTGLRLATPLNPIQAYTAKLEAPQTQPNEIKSKPPVLMIHGDADEVVPVLGSEAGVPALIDLGIAAKLHISQGAGHTIAQDGLDTATQFLIDLNSTSQNGAR